MKPKLEVLKQHFKSYDSEPLKQAGVNLENTYLSEMIYKLHEYEINPAIKAFRDGNSSPEISQRIEDTWALMRRIEKHYMAGATTDGARVPDEDAIQSALHYALSQLQHQEDLLAAYQGSQKKAEYVSRAQSEVKYAVGLPEDHDDLDLTSVEGFQKKMVQECVEEAEVAVRHAEAAVATARIDYEGINELLAELHENGVTIDKIVCGEGQLEAIIREMKVEADLALKAAHCYNPDNTPFVDAFAPIRDADKYNDAMRRFIAIDDAYRSFKDQHPTYKSDEWLRRYEYANYPQMLMWETISNSREVCSKLNLLNQQLAHLYMEGFLDDHHVINGGEGGNDPTIDEVFHEIIDALEVERQRCEKLAQFSVPDSMSSYKHYTNLSEEIRKVENDMLGFSNTLDAAVEESERNTNKEHLDSTAKEVSAPPQP